MADLDFTPEQAGRLLEPLSALTAQAAAAVLTFSHATAARRLKPDGTPVTAADEASESLLLAGLKALLPRVPVVTEERADAAVTDLTGSFVIVDPLDGTREFLAGREEYTINLALIHGGAPVAGIIASPPRRMLWRGTIGQRAERMTFDDSGLGPPSQIRTRAWPKSGAIAGVSRSHFDSATDAFLNKLGSVKREPCGSALKFGLLAEGGLDVYPRLAPTCEWDVAAGHALVLAAGGTLVTPQGRAPSYGRARERFRVSSFIAWGDPARAAAAAP